MSRQPDKKKYPKSLQYFAMGGYQYKQLYAEWEEKKDHKRCTCMPKYRTCYVFTVLGTDRGPMDMSEIAASIKEDLGLREFHWMDESKDPLASYASVWLLPQDLEKTYSVVNVFTSIGHVVVMGDLFGIRFDKQFPASLQLHEKYLLQALKREEIQANGVRWDHDWTIVYHGQPVWEESYWTTADGKEYARHLTELREKHKAQKTQEDRAKILLALTKEEDRKSHQEEITPQRLLELEMLEKARNHLGIEKDEITKTRDDKKSLQL